MPLLIPTPAPARTSEGKCWPAATRSAEVAPAKAPPRKPTPARSTQLASGRCSKCSVIPIAAPVHAEDECPEGIE